jgi:hypothetical protein
MPQDILASQGFLAFQGLTIICATVAFAVSLRFIRRLIELKHERRLNTPDNELADRLHRIEMTVEATALEVERISEANRFMAKLLAERATPGAALPKPERVITPH